MDVAQVARGKRATLHPRDQRAFDNTCYLTPTRTVREQADLLARASECGLMKEIGPLLLDCHRFVIGSQILECLNAR